MHGSLLFARDAANLIEQFEAIMIANGLDPDESKNEADPFAGHDIDLNKGGWALLWAAWPNMTVFRLAHGKNTVGDCEIGLTYDFDDQMWTVDIELDRLMPLIGKPAVQDLLNCARPYANQLPPDERVVLRIWNLMIQVFLVLRQD